MSDQPPVPPTLPGRRAPHPARTARRACGAAGVAGMVLITGYMATGGGSATAQGATGTPGPATVGTANAGANFTPAGRAVPASPSPKVRSSSHGS